MKWNLWIEANIVETELRGDEKEINPDINKTVLSSSSTHKFFLQAWKKDCVGLVIRMRLLVWNLLLKMINNQRTKSVWLTHLPYRSKFIRKKTSFSVPTCFKQQLLSRQHQFNKTPPMFWNTASTTITTTTLPAPTTFFASDINPSIANDCSMQHNCIYVISAVQRKFNYPSSFKSRSAHRGVLFSSAYRSFHIKHD